jgi:hypothetical protein
LRNLLGWEEKRETVMAEKSETDILRKNYLLATMAFLFKSFCEKFEELEETDHPHLVKCFEEMAGGDSVFWSEALFNVLGELNQAYINQEENEDGSD